MEWRPEDYYRSSPYEFNCACEGYFNKIDTQMRMHRVGAFMTYAANGGKESIEQFWPLKSDLKNTGVKMANTVDEALWEQIKQAHNIV